MKKLAIAAILGAAGVLAAEACLPGDTRPTPAVLHFQVEPSAATVAGFTTVDGWTITFDRLLVGLGNAGIEGDECNVYANAPYPRLFDFTVEGRQKLSDVYGLGTCRAYMSITHAWGDVILGAGVTEEDRVSMREGVTDPWTGAPTIASVYALGKAARGGVEKRFEWVFNLGTQREYCRRFDDPGVTLVGGREERVIVTLHGEELFRESLDDGAALRFDVMAEADVDGDQRVTLEELANVPGPEPKPDAGPPLLSKDGGPASLGDFVYYERMPAMVHLAGSVACQADMLAEP